MKKLFSVLLIVCMLAGMCTLPTMAAEMPTVYLKSGGSGDGSSADSPVGTVAAALAAAAAKSTDAKIQVIGGVDLDVSATFSSPEHSNKIVITGKGTDGTLYINTTNGTNGDNAIWYLNGTLQFENIKLDITPFRMYFVTQFHDIYMLDGVTHGEERSMGANEMGVLASLPSTTKFFDGFAFKKDYKMVFTSGRYNTIALFKQASDATPKGALDGTATLVFGGTAEVNDLSVAWDTIGSLKNAIIYIDGGVINKVACYHNQQKSTLDYYGMFGATGELKYVITDNYDVSKSFTVGYPGYEQWLFAGISGISCWYDGSQSVGNAYLGSYKIDIEAGVYDSVIEKVNADTFDANGVQKIASGSGLPEGIIPAMSDAVDENPGTGTDTPTQPENPGQTPETGDNAIIYMLVLIAATTIGFVTVSSKRRSVR